jgi:rhamnosyl/mannosyltransferase
MDLVHFITRVKKPTLVTYHADIIRQKYLLTCYRPLQQRFLKSVDAIVATSPQYLATSPVLQQFQDKTRIIPIGLDKSTYPTPTAERLSYWQQQFGTRFFLFVGVLRYYKGLGVLLEAARHNTYPIVILGSGPIESDLKKQANRLGLKHVHFLGQLSDLDKTALLTLCGAFIFPSNLRSEAFGIALLEAAMFGKPLISCDIGSGMSYINKPDETGLEVPANDPEALHRAMTWLWENPDEAYKLGKQAQARYESLFTTTQMVDAYTALYREITL